MFSQARDYLVVKVHFAVEELYKYTLAKQKITPNREFFPWQFKQLNIGYFKIRVKIKL